MTVLVTGATGGIGRAVVSALVERGDSVLATGRNLSVLDTLGVDSVEADLTQALGRERILAACTSVDRLVNCAGMIRYEELTAEGFSESLATNLVGPVLLAQSLASQLMAQAKPGSFVFLSSTLAQKPAPFTLAYSAAKAGIDAAVRALALEYGPRNIRVNSIALGVIETDMVKQPRPNGLDGDAAVSALAPLHLLARVGTPEEAARAILYALDAEFLTGQTLSIDGGLLVAP